jgi:hypothetical protein
VTEILEEFFERFESPHVVASLLEICRVAELAARRVPSLLDVDAHVAIFFLPHVQVKRHFFFQIAIQLRPLPKALDALPSLVLPLFKHDLLPSDLGRLKDARDGAGHTPPEFGFVSEAFSACGGEGVKLGAAIVV